jgi:hypothetical protein
MKDYLKHWKVVRHFFQKKYNLKVHDLEFLLFLRSEGRFTKKRAVEYLKLMETSETRFRMLIDEGWVVVWRKRKAAEWCIYTVSHKTKAMVSSLYDILDGGEIPAGYMNNPWAAHTKLNYIDNLRYKFMKKNMNLKQ